MREQNHDLYKLLMVFTYNCAKMKDIRHYFSQELFYAINLYGEDGLIPS